MLVVGFGGYEWGHGSIPSGEADLVRVVGVRYGDDGASSRHRSSRSMGLNRRHPCVNRASKCETAVYEHWRGGGGRGILEAASVSWEAIQGLIRIEIG